MSGFTLARWFQRETMANRPEDDFVREEVLSEVYRASAVGVTRSKTVFVRTPSGVCAIERKNIQGSPMLEFDFVENERWQRTMFWMNLSSLPGLGDYLRSVQRVDPNELFLQG
jgi:hypothetical protein